MKLNVYAVQDTNSSLFKSLFVYRTDKEAIFELSRVVPRHLIPHTRLALVGTYDNETGEIEGYDPTAFRMVDFEPVNVDSLATPAQMRKGSPQEVEHDWAVNNH